MGDKLVSVNFKGVIFMKKFRRKKLAFALACASILGGKSQAMDKNKPQSNQTLAAVGGVADKKSSQGFVNWVKNHKWQLTVGGTLTVAAAVTLTVLGVKYWGKKDSGGDPNEKGNNSTKNNDINAPKDLGTKDNDINPNKKQGIQNIKEVNDNSDGNQIIENKNNGDEGGNSKKDLNIKNKIKIEEQIQPQNEKEIKEQNTSNFQLINDAIINTEIDNIESEEGNKQKNLIIKAFKHLAETLDKKSVVEVLKLGILNKFSDNDFNDYFDNNSVEAIAKNFGSPIQELLDIFSNKSKISVDPWSYKVDNNVGFGLNLNNKAKITCYNKIKDEVVEIKYDSSPKGNYNSCSHIYFKIPHNLLNKN